MATFRGTVARRLVRVDRWTEGESRHRQGPLISVGLPVVTSVDPDGNEIPFVSANSFG